LGHFFAVKTPFLNWITLLGKPSKKTFIGVYDKQLIQAMTLVLGKAGIPEQQI